MVYTIIGAKGFLGGHFYRYFQRRGIPVVGTHYRSTPLLKHLDLKDPKVDGDFKGSQYALICGGITSMDLCERDVKGSFACNVEGPLALGKQLIAKGILPIFFSTNYLFDGQLGVYDEGSVPSPLNEYGRQKAILEKRVQEELQDAPMIRLSKVYGTDKGDKTLFDEMAATVSRGGSLKAAVDIWLAPIHVEDVVRESLAFVERGGRGIIHLSSQIEATRFEMALKMVQQLGGEVIPIRNDCLQGKRPLRAHLKANIKALSWQEGIQRVVNNYAKK